MFQNFDSSLTRGKVSSIRIFGKKSNILLKIGQNFTHSSHQLNRSVQIYFLFLYIRKEYFDFEFWLHLWFHISLLPFNSIFFIFILFKSCIKILFALYLMPRLNNDVHVRCSNHALCYVTVFYQQQN